MNAFFLSVKADERENILSQHRKVYDGYQTLNPAAMDAIQPLYTQDFANDKEGLVVNNKGEVMPYTNMGINESKLDFSPLGYAKRVMKGDISIEDAMEESGLPFMLISRLVKKLTGKSLDIREEEMCEQCDQEMSEENGDKMTLSMLGDAIMNSQEFQDIFSMMDPSEFDDEFEYSDNVLYNVLQDYEGEPFYDDLYDYVKDNYSESLFDSYLVTVGGNYSDEDNTEDIDYEELDEIYADDMDVSDEESAYQFVSHGPDDVYGTMKDYDSATDSYHKIDSMKDVQQYDDSSDINNMFGDLSDGMAFSDEDQSDTFQHDAGDVDREGDSGLGMDTENDMDLSKVKPAYDFMSDGPDDPYGVEEEEDIEEMVDEDLRESFKEKRKLVMEMMSRMSKF
jgi:hypothetical protein